MSTALDTPTSPFKEKPPLSPTGSVEEQKLGYNDTKEQGVHRPADVDEVFEDVRTIDLDETGKERPIGALCLTFSGPVLMMCAETEQDYALRLISLEDDPTLPVFTFRSMFLGTGLACFGAVLGQLFVRYPFLLDMVSTDSFSNYCSISVLKL